MELESPFVTFQQWTETGFPLQKFVYSENFQGNKLLLTEISGILKLIWVIDIQWQLTIGQNFRNISNFIVYSEELRSTRCVRDTNV